MSKLYCKALSFSIVGVLVTANPALALTSLSEVEVEPKRVNKPSTKPKVTAKPKAKSRSQVKSKPKPKPKPMVKSKPKVKPPAITASQKKKNQLIQSLKQHAVLRYAYSFSEGLAAIKYNSQCGYLNTNGQIAIPLNYSECAEFHQGFARVKSTTTKKCGFIDKNNEPLTTFEYDCRLGAVLGRFKYGYALLEQGDKRAMINTQGKFVIPFVYSHGILDVRKQLHENGVATYHHADKVEISSSGKKIYAGYRRVIDTNGDIAFDLQENFRSQLRFYSDGLARFKNSKDQYGFVDTYNNVVIEPQFDSVRDFNGDKAVFKKEDKYGLIDKTGAVIVAPIYNYIYNQENGIAVVKLKDKKGLVDSKGKLIIKPKYDAIDGFKNGLAVIKSNKRYGVINYTTGEVIIKPTHHSITLTDDLILVRNGNYLKGYYDLNGKPLIKPRYQKLGGLHGDFSDGLIPAEKNHKVGFIDINEKVIIPFVFDNAEPFSDGYARIKFDGKYGYIDKQGQPLKIEGLSL